MRHTEGLTVISAKTSFVPAPKFSQQHACQAFSREAPGFFNTGRMIVHWCLNIRDNLRLSEFIVYARHQVLSSCLQLVEPSHTARESPAGKLCTKPWRIRILFDWRANSNRPKLCRTTTLQTGTPFLGRSLIQCTEGGLISQRGSWKAPCITEHSQLLWAPAQLQTHFINYLQQPLQYPTSRTHNSLRRGSWYPNLCWSMVGIPLLCTGNETSKVNIT